MKTPTLFALSLLALVTIAPNPASAQAVEEKKPAKEGGNGGHSHFIEIPATEAEVWTEIGKQQVKLDAVVAAEKLGEAHDHGFAIRDLVRALPAKVPAENKAKAEAAIPEINKLAAAVDKSAAGGAQKVTEENVKKLTTAITTLQTALKTK
jgi:hypothetical protein